MAAIIQVKNLTKTFGDLTAVDDLSFEVEKGNVYGFLGQNGAGKSTTIRMLLTLITPTSGSIEIMGMNLQSHRRQILSQVGAIIEKPDLYKYLTALENLKLFAVMSGIRPDEKKLMDQLAMVGLAERAKSKVKTFSQGMKQRLGIATALVHDPQLIILDEPTNGLDPQGIADVRKLLGHLTNDLGKTLVISSHLLSEMELVADSILIIDRGRKVVEGTRDELLNPAMAQVEILTDEIERAITVIRGTEWADNLTTDGQSIFLVMQKAEVPDLNRVLVEKEINIFSLRPKHSLEDYFLSITGN
jgi:ABC-type multidrug transport system ATPase subunit